MNGKSMIAIVTCVLLASGALAQTLNPQAQVAPSPLQGVGQQVRDLPDLTIQVPIDVQALSGRVEEARIRCLVTVDHPDINARDDGPNKGTGGKALIVRRRSLPLTNGGYQGVVTFQFHVPEDLTWVPRRDEWGPEHITHYQCHLMLCGEGVQGSSRFGGADHNCKFPEITGSPEPDWLAADRSAPFQAGVGGPLQ